MKFGINLYGILQNRKDTLAALKELRDLGFSSVELDLCLHGKRHCHQRNHHHNLFHCSLVF